MIAPTEIAIPPEKQQYHRHRHHFFTTASIASGVTTTVTTAKSESLCLNSPRLLDVTDDAYEPNTQIVKVTMGATVKWTNDDSVPHTLLHQAKMELQLAGLTLA